MMSFTATGTPRNAPCSARRSTSRAWAIARSGSMYAHAWTSCSRAPTRARHAPTIASAVAAPEDVSRTISVAVRSFRLPLCRIQTGSSLFARQSDPRVLLKRRPAGEIMADDLLAGGETYPVMRADVLQGAVKRADAMRHAHHERVQTDGHDTTRFGALAIEHVKLGLYHALELVRGAEAIINVRRVVDLVGIRDGRNRASADIHQIRLIIVHPICDIQ